MSAFTGAALRAGRAGRGLLPTGQLLTPEVWARRHRGIVWLLWLHVAGIAVFALARGETPGHALAEASAVGRSRWSPPSRGWVDGPARRRPCSA
jgi:hypothetical protein